MAGPSGLAAAIRLKQLNPDMAVCLVEKGGEIGAHILSGAVLEPRALNELIPDWKEKGAPLDTPAGEDRFLFLTATRSFKTADPAADAQSRQLHRLARQRRPLAGSASRGIGRRDLSRFRRRRIAGGGRPHRRHRHRRYGHRQGWQPTGNFQRGMELRARYTLFAEGCRGSLSKQLMQRFNLRDGRDPQTYGIGIKELWEIPAANHKPGPDRATASAGRSGASVYGGSFLYHFGDQPGVLRRS